MKFNDLALKLIELGLSDEDISELLNEHGVSIEGDDDPDVGEWDLPEVEIPKDPVDQLKDTLAKVVATDEPKLDFSGAPGEALNALRDADVQDDEEFMARLKGILDTVKAPEVEAEPEPEHIMHGADDLGTDPELAARNARIIETNDAILKSDPSLLKTGSKRELEDKMNAAHGSLKLDKSRPTARGFTKPSKHMLDAIRRDIGRRG